MYLVVSNVHVCLLKLRPRALALLMVMWKQQIRVLVLLFGLLFGLGLGLLFGLVMVFRHVRCFVLSLQPHSLASHLQVQVQGPRSQRHSLRWIMMWVIPLWVKAFKAHHLLLRRRGNSVDTLGKLQSV